MKLLLFIKHVFFLIFRGYEFKYDKDWDTLLHKLLTEGRLHRTNSVYMDDELKFEYNGKYYTIVTGEYLKCYGTLLRVHNSLYSASQPAIHSDLRYRPSFRLLCALMELQRACNKQGQLNMKAEIYGFDNKVIEED